MEPYDEYTFDVTEDHIRNSIPGDPEQCAIARAYREAFWEERLPYVKGTSMIIPDDESPSLLDESITSSDDVIGDEWCLGIAGYPEGRELAAVDALEEWVKRYDRDKQVKPITVAYWEPAF